MSYYAKILSLSYDSAEASKTTALKTYWRSVRLLKESGAINPAQPSYVTNILLCGNCIDPENRNLYVFYIDTYYGSAWIIEINIDTRVQTVVYYDKYNAIGFSPDHKIYNARVVHGRLIWTDNLNPIYQMDIARAKRSFYYKIGYGQYTTTVEWEESVIYGIGQIVSSGNSFYKSLIDTNIDTEPRTDSGLIWEKLCLIEDAYYSMNVENFYFEPAPPKHSPVVEYQSDDARKINNLRQTLFQVSYRYVYMDWRKSTFSPASIVNIPQAEEETATGLANEQISLNNKLQITVNTGGEEVRAIEVIGRSSEDISSWFLIDIINKLEEQEIGSEISMTTESEYLSMAISVSAPTVSMANISTGARNNIGLTPLNPDVFLSWVSSIPAMAWLAAEGGVGDKQDITIECTPVLLYLTSKPSWITIRSAGGYDFSVGMSMLDDDVISVFPTTVNTAVGVSRTGTIVLTNAYGDYASITVYQAGAIPPPPVPIVCTLEKDPDDESPMTLSDAIATAMSEDNEVTLTFRPNNPDYETGEAFTISWRADIGVLPYGNGSFTAYNLLSNSPSAITLLRNIDAGETVSVYLSTVDILKASILKISMGIVPLLPTVISSAIGASAVHLGWLAAEGGIDDKEDLIIDCSPSNAYLSVKPSWITIMRGSYEMSVGMYLNDGDTLYVFPTYINTGSAIPSTPITFNTIYGDSVSVYVEQDAAIVSPPSDITCTVGVDIDEPTGLTISGAVGSTTSGSTIVRVQGTLAGGSAPFILWWKVEVNWVVQGHNAIANVYNGSIDVYLAIDVEMLTGDNVRVYLSTVEIT